jgi:ribosome-binding factor A
MSDPAKTRRHAERVRELVASLVREIKDPRLGMVTITDARITGDLREATVYYTVLGDTTEQAGTQTALESAKGMLRSRVGHALVRSTPATPTPTRARKTTTRTPPNGWAPARTRVDLLRRDAARR